MRAFYIFIFTLFMGSYLIGKSRNFRNPSKAMMIYAWIVIVFFCGGIDALQQGGDITNYYNHVLRANQQSFAAYAATSSFEQGYLLIVWLLSSYLPNPQIYMYLQYGFTTAVFLYFIYKNTPDCFSGLVFFVCIGGFTFYMTAYRQGIAAAICLLGILQLQKGRTIRALLLMLIATQFHQTAIVFIPFILVYKIPLSKKSILWFTVLAITVISSLEKIVGFANEQFDMGYNNGVNGSVGSLINFMIFLFFLYELYKTTYNPHSIFIESIEKRSLSVVVYMALASILLYAMRFAVLALERVAFYFIPALCPLWGYVMYERLDAYGRQKNSELIALILIVLLCVRFSHTFGGMNLIYW